MPALDRKSALNLAYVPTSFRLSVMRKSFSRWVSTDFGPMKLAVRRQPSANHRIFHELTQNLCVVIANPTRKRGTDPALARRVRIADKESYKRSATGGLEPNRYESSK